VTQGTFVLDGGLDAAFAKLLRALAASDDCKHQTLLELRMSCRSDVETGRLDVLLSTVYSIYRHAYVHT